MSYLKKLNGLIFGSRRLAQWRGFFTDFLGMPMQEQAGSILASAVPAGKTP